MLVYGDSETRTTPAGKLDRIRTLLADAHAQHGIQRHGLLVAALIEAGELAQGIADAAFEARGRLDAPSPAADAATALTCALARRVARSWGAAFAEAPAADDVTPALARVAGDPDLPAHITVEQPEGFAHYAVYPEAYLAAAAGLPRAPTQIVGIRSIGTTLAAMLAAAIPGAPAPVTLRPGGHPYRREIAAAPALAADLSGEPDAIVAIADEGPGFSGSSFGSVALWLEGHGLPLERIHLVPSHGGEPGAQSHAEIRRVWRTAPRHVRTFDDIVLHADEPAHRLESWVADLVGAPLRPMVEISGGEWRAHRDTGTVPPVHAWQEKRKFLVHSETGSWLLKFAGLGQVGLAKWERGRTLAGAGFTPEVLGWRHGFLVERWQGSARPLDPGPETRAAIIDHVGNYLGFRASRFPVERGRGASAAALFAMACHNVTLDLGDLAAAALQPWGPRLERLERARRPLETDNRLHAWEWLVDGGRILKTDALDHHAGHDLVGPQDMAWDIAGATIELGLVPAERETLMGAAEQASGIRIDPELTAFCLLAYPAFQLGYYAMAAAGTGDATERSSLDAAAERYRTILRESLLPL